MQNNKAIIEEVHNSLYKQLKPLEDIYAKEQHYAQQAIAKAQAKIIEAMAEVKNSLKFLQSCSSTTP